MTILQLTIAFLPASNDGLSFRGTEVALYDYADQLELLYNHRPIICLKFDAFHEPVVLRLFKKRFPIIFFSNSTDLEDKLISNNVNALYTIRSSPTNGLQLNKIPMLIHCVYQMDKHNGLVCAGISESIAQKSTIVYEPINDSTKFSNKLDKELSTINRSFVPHMINLYNTNNNYRTKLNIPTNAIVIGRHGGKDTWNLPMAKNVLLRILNERNDIYFLFAVRPIILQNINHPRLICLKPFANPRTKRKFINTCDYCFHAQSLGESFGLSIGEMSTANKPIIVWNGGINREHLRILGSQCFKYSNEEELFNIINTLNPTRDKLLSWNKYTDYTPAKVMAQFDNIFIQPLINNISS